MLSLSVWPEGYALKEKASNVPGDDSPRLHVCPMLKLPCGDAEGLGLALRILCLSRVASVLAALIPHLSCSSRTEAVRGIVHTTSNTRDGRRGLFSAEGGVSASPDCTIFVD